MPPMEHMDRNQWAVYWEKVGQDDYNVPLVKAGVEHRVRWVDKRRTVMSPTGTPIDLDAQVSLVFDPPEGSIFWQGRDDDLPGTGTSPGDAPTTELYQVVYRNTAKDLKGRVSRTDIGLKRYTGTLPRIVE